MPNNFKKLYIFILRTQSFIINLSNVLVMLIWNYTVMLIRIPTVSNLILFARGWSLLSLEQIVQTSQ